MPETSLLNSANVRLDLLLYRQSGFSGHMLSLFRRDRTVLGRKDFPVAAEPCAEQTSFS
jgi:hypothetical protein